MSKYRPKTKSSFHGKKRFSQRYDGPAKKAESLADRALHYGIHFSQIPPELKLSEFVFFKKTRMNKKIRLLDGYVVVLSRSGRLITLYTIPDEFREEYETIRHMQDENKENYRRTKRA